MRDHAERGYFSEDVELFLLVLSRVAGHFAHKTRAMGAAAETRWSSRVRMGRVCLRHSEGPVLRLSRSVALKLWYRGGAAVRDKCRQHW